MSTAAAAEGAASVAALIARERNVLGQIASGLPLAQVLEELLRAVEAQSGHAMLTSVLFLSEDGRHLLHGAAPSLPAAYNAVIDGIAVGEGMGSCGTVASRGSPVYAHDIATDPLWADFRDLALAHGLRACWSTPIRAADGALLGTFAIYYDTPRSPTGDDVGAIAFITQTAALAIERHRLELRIRHTEGELRALNADLERRVVERSLERDRAWRLSQDLLVVADADGVLLAVNNAWSDLLGWERDELLGKSFVAFTHPEDLTATLAAFAGIFEVPLTRPYEYRLQHKDGSFRWFAWTGTFEGERVYANGRHVTLEHEQASALAKAEEALRQSQKMEAVGQLTGGLAHDFNNLLTGITGSLELLGTRLSQGRLGELDRYVLAAQGAARRAAALTHRLLAFSRRQTLDPKPTDVNRLVSGMEELVRRSVGPAITVEVVAAGGLWASLIDPGQLENALLNLCINARDAMPDGGRLTIETANLWLDERAAQALDLTPGQYMSLCVSDTGAGMAPDVMARAFDPFFTTKPIGLGTGLGLSMVYGFARQSGGQARIYSEPGQGAMVCLYLPRHHGEKAGFEALTTPAAAPRARVGETVLVVDDEATVRMLVAEVLDDLGYATLEAADGPAGLEVLQSDARVDLLITDVGLPGGMNGRQVADAGRTARPGLRVLFITGYAENAVVGNGHLEPGMHVMTKPFAMDALATRIQAIVGKT